MISMTRLAGIDAWVDPCTGALELGDGLVAEERATRELGAARGVYERVPDRVPSLYHMLNGITARADPDKRSRLRYELTSLRGGTVGTEWVKTIGHIHNAAPDGHGFPEAYEVVSGEAIFLLFRPGVTVIVEGRRGDRFMIPPGWHHLAINHGAEAMVFADVVARAVTPDYSLLHERRGGPVYLGPGGPRQNPRWPGSRVLRLRCEALPDGLPGGARLSDLFFGDRAALDVLLHPGAYADTWRAFDAVVANAAEQQPAS
jgi:glucose-6-phosphate isomerase